MGLWTFKITNVENSDTNDDKIEDYLNLLSKEENVGNSNLFEEKRSDKFEKRRDAVIGTEYWGRKKRIIKTKA